MYPPTTASAAQEAELLEACPGRCGSGPGVAAGVVYGPDILRTISPATGFKPVTQAEPSFSRRADGGSFDADYGNRVRRAIGGSYFRERYVRPTNCR